MGDFLNVRDKHIKYNNNKLNIVLAYGYFRCDIHIAQRSTAHIQKDTCEIRVKKKWVAAELQAISRKKKM